MVAGKTGTIEGWQQGYSDNQHVSVFAGFVPARNNPKVAIVVVVDDHPMENTMVVMLQPLFFQKLLPSTMRILNVRKENYIQKEYILVKK